MNEELRKKMLRVRAARMSPVLVKGAECPSCQTEHELEGEFYEGQEVDCACGAVLHIDSVAAIYTVKLSRIDIPEETAHE